MLSPFECLYVNFILPETASYVFFMLFSICASYCTLSNHIHISIYLKCDVHEQRNAAENERDGNIDITADAVPELAAAPYAAGANGIHELALFHDIKPRHSAERCADGDDVYRDKIHPRSPLGNRLHAKSEAEAQKA